MISIIICSVNLQMLEELKTNIEKTIEVNYELIIYDNSVSKWGLCRVYNYCVKKAVYPYVCFLHEDMYFHTKGWGKILIGEYNKNSNTGVIGLAGSTMVTKNFVEWKINKIYSYVYVTLATNIDLPLEGKLQRFFNYRNELERVLTLDGMMIFVSKTICIATPFDETNFTNFHIYDADFTYAVALKYNNYVTSKILSTHRCRSRFNAHYVEGLFIFRKKWETTFPNMITGNGNLASFYITELHQMVETVKLLSQNGQASIMSIKYVINENGFLGAFLVPYILFDRLIAIVLNIKIRKL